jgi:hypothetical protein
MSRSRKPPKPRSLAPLSIAQVPPVGNRSGLIDRARDAPLIEALCTHFGVDMHSDTRDLELLFAVLRRLYPPALKRGRPAKWTDPARTALLMAVMAQGAVPLKTALRNLAEASPWNAFAGHVFSLTNPVERTFQTLKRQHSLAKRCMNTDLVAIAGDIVALGPQRVRSFTAWALGIEETNDA